MLIENKWVVHDSSDNTYFTGLRDLTDPEGDPIRDPESGGVAQAPVMEELNSRVRIYKNEKGAKQAVRKILDISPSEHTVLRKFEVVYIEKRDVPDVPGDIKDKSSDNLSDKPEPSKFTEVKDRSGWQEVYGFAFPMESLIVLRGLDRHIRASEKLGEMKYCKSTVGIGDFGTIKLCRKAVGDREMFGVIAADGKLYSAGLGGGAAALEKFCDECRNYLMPRVTRGDRKDKPICPACGGELRPAVRCGKYNSSICQSHCVDNGGCEHFNDYGGMSIWHCSYWDKLIERQKREESDRQLAEILGK